MKTFLSWKNLCYFFLLSVLFLILNPLRVSAQIYGLPDLPQGCDPCTVTNTSCPAGKQLNVLERNCTASDDRQVQCPFCMDIPPQSTPEWCTIPVCPVVTCTEKQSLLIDGGRRGWCKPPRGATPSSIVNSPYPHGSYYCVRCQDCCPNEPTSCPTGQKLAAVDRKCDTRTIKCNTCVPDTCDDPQPGTPLSKIISISNVNIDNKQMVNIVFSKGSKPYTGREIKVGNKCGDSDVAYIKINGEIDSISDDREEFSYNIGVSWADLQNKCFQLIINNGCTSTPSNEYKIIPPGSPTPASSPTPTPSSTPTPVPGSSPTPKPSTPFTAKKVDDLPVTGAKETTFFLVLVGSGLLAGGVYLRFKK